MADAADRALLQRLAALLADDDSDAVELFKEAGPALAALLGPTAYGGMQRALDNYLFTDALAVLHSAPAPDTPSKENPAHEHQPSGTER